MSGVKSFVIFAMTAFYFPIMPCVAKGLISLWQMSLFLVCVETSLEFFSRLSKAFGEFCAIVCLNTFYRHWKMSDKMFDKNRRE